MSTSCYLVTVVYAAGSRLFSATSEVGWFKDVHECTRFAEMTHPRAISITVEEKR